MNPDHLPAPVPSVNPETQTFWDATARGVLMLKRCDACQAVIWYPRQLCPECGSLETTWFDASGRGRIYSYTVNHRGEGEFAAVTPYAIAYIELDEGPRVLSNIVESDLDELAVGKRVEVVFHDTGEGPCLYRFRLSED